MDLVLSQLLLVDTKFPKKLSQINPKKGRKKERRLGEATSSFVAAGVAMGAKMSRKHLKSLADDLMQLIR